MFIYDLVDPTDLVGFARGIAQEAIRNRFVLQQLLPARPVADTEFRITRGNLLDEDSATYRAFDTEAPIAKRQGVVRITGQIPPMSRKIALGEEERLKSEALRSGDQGRIRAALYDDAGKMTRALLVRIERAIGEVLWSGKLVLNENGITGTADYGRKAGHTVAPGTLWSDPDADIINDYSGWVQTYIDTNGVPPAGSMISTAIVNNLMRNNKLRVQASSIAGTPQRINRTQLNAVLDDFSLPPLFVNDETVRVDGAATRVIPSNKLVMLPPGDEPLGNTLVGQTAEALELQGAGFLLEEQTPGITVVTMKEFDPVKTWTKAAGLVLPVLGNPDLTFTATVQ